MLHFGDVNYGTFIAVKILNQLGMKELLPFIWVDTLNINRGLT